MPDENYMNDSPGPGPAGAPPTEDQAASDSGTALLPKSFFPAEKELSPGNTCQIEIAEVFDDQVSVIYRHDAAEEPEVPSAPIDEEMAGYMGE